MNVQKIKEISEESKKEESKIKAPWFDTKKWYDLAAPEYVRNDPYLQGYLGMKQFQIRVLILVVAIVSYISGWYGR